MTGLGLSNKVFEAIKLLDSSWIKNEGENLSSKDFLQKLEIFDRLTLNALIKTAVEDDVILLIEEAADVLLSTYDSLDENEKRAIHWFDTKKEMVKKIENAFPEWFGVAKKVVENQMLIQQFERDIAAKERNMKLSTSALISTEEEMNKLKGAFSKEFDVLKKEIETNSCLDTSEKKDLLCELEKSNESVMEFIERKLAEKPVHLLYFKTGNKVHVKINLHQASYSYHKGRKRAIRINRGEDNKDFPLIVSVNYLEAFLKANEVRDEDLYIDTNSVDHFYCFEEAVSANLTPSFIRDWYKLDCPDLFRLTPNKKRHVNMLGMPLSHFSNKLVEASWSGTFIDNEITIEEANKLMENHPNTAISEEIRAVLKSKRIKYSDEIEKFQSFVNEYDSRIQSLINQKSTQIIKELTKKFGERGEDGEVRIKNDFGLDCGYVNIYSNDKDYVEKRSVVRNAKQSMSQYMDITMPYLTQSTTILNFQFSLIKEIVESEIGISLYAKTILD